MIYRTHWMEIVGQKDLAMILEESHKRMKADYPTAAKIRLVTVQLLPRTYHEEVEKHRAIWEIDPEHPQ